MRAAPGVTAGAVQPRRRRQRPPRALSGDVAGRSSEARPAADHWLVPPEVPLVVEAPVPLLSLPLSVPLLPWLPLLVVWW